MSILHAPMPKEATRVHVSNTILRGTLDLADTMLAFLDRDFKFLAVTPMYAKVCRCRPQDLVGVSFFTLVPKPEVRKIFLRTRATGRPVFRRNRTHVYAGSPKSEVTYWDWSLTPTKDRAGRVVGFVFVLRDMTRPRRAEEQARRSEQRLKIALGAAGMVIWEWDTWTNRIRYAENAQAIARGDDLEPYSTVDALIDMVHPDDRTALAEAVRRTQQENKPFECEYRVRMIDGAYHWILGQGGIVITKRGKPTRILGVSQNITRRKMAEMELRARSRQLAELASELTMVEHRERRRLAELLHEELQQLLFAAKMQADSLQGLEKGRTQRRLAELGRTITEAMASARAITRDLAPPVAIQRDLPMALQSLALDMESRHGLKVRADLCSNCGLATEATSVLLFTAARELLMNVVKHARTQRAELRTRCGPDWVELRVCDRGVGMNSDALKTPTVSGGFGLFSIRERAELLGGTLTVQSSPRRGTCTILRLPMAPGCHPCT